MEANYYSERILVAQVIYLLLFYISLFVVSLVVTSLSIVSFSLRGNVSISGFGVILLDCTG